MNLDTWLSRASLHLELLGRGSRSWATGFVIAADGEFVLVTCRHVVTGLNNDTGEYMPGLTSESLPVRVVVHHRTADGHTCPVEVDLFHEPGVPAWREHPQHRGAVDVVALPIPAPPTGATYAHPVPTWPPRVVLPVTSRVSVVGFPQGISVADRVAVWTTGFTASETGLPVDDLPMFLIDAATREGQSGSPVLWYNARGRILTTDGSLIDNGSEHAELLGVYSGRLRDDSTLGRVWRADAVARIVTDGVPGSVSD